MHIHTHGMPASSPRPDNPAQMARAAQANDPQLQDVSFGALVSRAARGLPLSEPPASSSSGNDGPASSGTVGLPSPEPVQG